MYSGARITVPKRPPGSNSNWRDKEVAPRERLSRLTPNHHCIRILSIRIVILLSTIK
ncbi:hypothetical protein AX14_003290 [Amanita brunnescens Koide BX004]|nr:hypothetical protein AX14_003290 [Amanita brunnescens Koide BX004]